MCSVPPPNHLLSLTKSNKMDTEIVGSIDATDITDDARSFSWAVDSAIRSETGSILGESRVRSFASLVDSAIRSSSASEADLGTYPSPVHAFASAVDIRTVAARLFSLAELKVATNNFSFDNAIGTAGLGVIVYRGNLIDGREVSIEKGKTWSNSFGKSEFASFSRLHHKNLVGLVGFCEQKDERLLVYEYMKNGGLYHHLHGKKGSSVLNSWKMRIKIAFDVSQGIQYLHNYASIIHRNIKSSNILFDATWTARVSGFDLSLMNPEPDRDWEIVGTFGYVDPEYCRLNVVSVKSDVYGLGVVLLEILTGRRAIFDHAEGHGGTPFKSVVDFAVPPILARELVKILDPRVGPPDVNEAEAVELVAYTAIHCVNLEGKDRPTMADIVANLERAFGYF